VGVRRCGDPASDSELVAALHGAADTNWANVDRGQAGRVAAAGADTRYRRLCSARYFLWRFLSCLGSRSSRPGRSPERGNVRCDGIHLLCSPPACEEHPQNIRAHRPGAEFSIQVAFGGFWWLLIDRSVFSRLQAPHPGTKAEEDAPRPILRNRL